MVQHALALLLVEAEKAFTEQSSDSFYASRGVRLQSLEMTRCFDGTGFCCCHMLLSYIYKIYKESGWWFQICFFNVYRYFGEDFEFD